MSGRRPASADPLTPVLARARWCTREVLESTVALAREIAREGNEGHPCGALFTIGHAEEVLAHSRPLILDPLKGHVPSATHVDDPRLRGTVKELAQLDGAFVMAGDGTLLAACRYLDVPSAGVRVPMGYGSRHLAAAAASKHLGVLAIAVSQTGMVRVFCQGKSMAEFPPR